jgi:RNA polymerase sigma-70 factor (ECF subfamily)
MERRAMNETPAHMLTAGERDRLVRLCIRLTGDPDAAEDLAQETLLEAWRHEADLRNPERWSRWLSGIARNVCLRWMRQRGQERASTGAAEVDELPGGDDLELELEREEIAALLDRALGLLPPETRSVLIGRYIEGLPQAEMAARLGLQSGTVAVRLHRGKLALRRVLAEQLRDEAEQYGLPLPADDGFRETRIWCFLCGRQRLMGRIQGADTLYLRCDACCTAPDAYVTHSHLPGVFAGISGYRAAYTRVVRALHEYNWQALTGRTTLCRLCGSFAEVNPVNPEPHPFWPPGRHGVFMRCTRCGAVNQSPLSYMVLGLPELQRFWRAHPRLRLLPEREGQRDGRPVLILGAESVTDGAVMEVVCARSTYEILSVHDPRA